MEMEYLKYFCSKEYYNNPNNFMDITVYFKNGQHADYEKVEKFGIFRWNGPFGFTTDSSVDFICDSSTGEVIFEN